MTTTTRTTRAPWALAATLAVLAGGLLAGCSTSSNDSATSSDANDRGRAFAACMRDKGYDVPDPDPDGANFRVPTGVDPAQYQRDTDSCNKKAWPGGAGKAEATVIPGSKELDRKVTACLRENGFADYPDDDDARAAWEPSDPKAFETTVRKCEDEAGLPKGEQIGG